MNTFRDGVPRRADRSVAMAHTGLENHAMNIRKRATPGHPIHPMIAERWSPYAFVERPVSDGDLRSLFEAARWGAP
jgi:hypothetical protein